MPELAEIQPEDFDEIHARYLEEDDPRLGRNDWHELFRPICSSVPQSGLGYKLTHAGRIVGILGMIYSRRLVAGTEIDFCNLHSWFVDPDHRGNSLLLMRPLLRLKNLVITDFSPTPAVIRISQRLGFRLFRIRQRILPFRCARRSANTSATTFWNDDIDSELLDPADQVLNRDHSSPRFCRLLVQSGNRSVFMITRKVDFHWRPYTCLLYASNPGLLAETQSLWQNQLRDRHHVRRIVGAEKYLPRELAGSYPVPFPNQQLYRSGQHGPEVIDTLYSEVSMLGLATLPGFRSIVRHSSQTINPARWFRRSQLEA